MSRCDLRDNIFKHRPDQFNAVRWLRLNRLTGTLRAACIGVWSPENRAVLNAVVLLHCHRPGNSRVQKPDLE